MLKRGVVFLFVFVLVFGVFVSGVIAQEEEGGASGVEDVINDAVVGPEDNIDQGAVDDINEGDVDNFNAGVVEDDIEGELDKEYEGVGLEHGAGLTPDSAFYFIDEFFDRFGDEIENKEEKVAEIKVMIEEGKFEDARRALVRYRVYADNLEKEVDPEKRDEARRSAAAIRNTLREIENEIPEDERDEFVNDVIDREGKIVTAVEIASKIKDLCISLSELDPVEYSRVCRADDRAPEWQKRLHGDLTKDQEREAREFFGIMSQCFRTSGRECRCEDISVTAFADKCAVVAPLAVQCDEGDEEACDRMDLETEGMEDLLPDYLSDVLADLEGEFENDQFENHAPRECREAGANTRDECFTIMFKLNAPPACVEAFDRGEINPGNSEREAREACEKIMFEREAPDECKEAGLNDFKECGKFMFKLNAPPECINAGLTGEHRSDERKCREIAGGFEGREQGPGGGFGGGNCGGIDDPKERLKCYDGAARGVGEYHEDVRRGPSGGWPPACRAAKAFTREECEEIMEKEYGERIKETRRYELDFAEDCRAKGGAWDCSYGEASPGESCRCHFRDDVDEEYPYDCTVISCFEGQVCSPHLGCISSEERERELEENYDDYEYPLGPDDPGYVDNTAKYDCSKLDCGGPPNYCDPWQGCVEEEGGFNPDGSSCDEGYEWDGSKCIPFGTGDYGFENNCPEGQFYDENGVCSSGDSGPESSQEESPPEPSTEEVPPSEPPPGTGGVIFIDSDFYNYYFR